MFAPLPISKFISGWAPALLFSATVDPAPRLADLFAVHLAGGVIIPPVTCVLGALGVLAARPLARKAESALPWPLFLLVSVIMLLVVELWVIDSRPGALFAFVVAIGLGFSGYSLIELVGDKVRTFISNIVAGAASKVSPGAINTAGDGDSNAG